MSLIFIFACQIYFIFIFSWLENNYTVMLNRFIILFELFLQKTLIRVNSMKIKYRNLKLYSTLKLYERKPNLHRRVFWKWHNWYTCHLLSILFFFFSNDYAPVTYLLKYVAKCQIIIHIHSKTLIQNNALCLFRLFSVFSIQ